MKDTTVTITNVCARVWDCMDPSVIVRISERQRQ